VPPVAQSKYAKIIGGVMLLINCTHPGMHMIVDLVDTHIILPMNIRMH